MKVLIVNAFACRKAFKAFDKLVRAGFETVLEHEQGQTEFIVRDFNKLEDFCYDNEAAGLSSKAAIAAVDKLDFVFVDGDSRLLPWHPRTRKLLVFLRTVLGAKKCLFAAGPGAHVVAYVCATGGKALRVLNGGGDGGSLLELSSLRPEDLGSTCRPACGGEAQEAVLDSTTGDFYVFDCKTDRWIAEGNVGVQKIKAGIGGVAAAILADACSGFGNNSCARKIPINDLLGIKRSVQCAADISSKTLQRPNTPRVQGEVLVRVRPKSTQHRFLKHVHCCEFLAWSPGKWSIDESTAARCRRTFTVLASSNRAGAEVLEIDNCIATRFNIRQEYKDAIGLLQAFVEHKHLLIRDQNRIDRDSDFVTKGIQTGDGFDGMIAASSHKHTGPAAVAEVAAAAAAAKRLGPEGAASRRHQPQDSKRGTAKKRAGPFPRRPQPTEKPRFAPPHSTRPIRAAAASRATGRGRAKGARVIFAGNAVSRGVAGGRGGAGSNDCNGARMATAVDDGMGGTNTGSLPYQDDAGAHVGLSSPRRSRGTDPTGRRRVLMARVGEGLGLDLSQAIDALLRREDCQNPTSPNNTQPSHTARTAPAEFGRIHVPGEYVDPTDVDGAGVVKGGHNQDTADESIARLGSEEGLHDDEYGSGVAEMAYRARRGDKVTAPRRARSVPGGGRGTDRRRRGAATNSLVRVPGHDRRRPYNNFHRFKKMEKETRDVFFSLGGSSGSARVYDEKVAGRGEQGIEASRDDASAAVVESGRQSKTGIAAHGRNTGKQPLFSANFGTKQAWASAQEPAIRTQGPYLGKNWGSRREASETKPHLLNPKRWAVTGAKRQGWSGIGEGAGFAKNAA